ncbi:MAG: thioether cross-link-forming SCIFF peptide maturase [Firmicutes bacterium]|nr:thioether cross-link-forming SCIFF peptide maturase [Bacillota bacterium]
MIHAYQLNGYNIILDCNSGSVHAVDEVAYDMIRLYENKSREEVTAEILAKYADREDVTEKEINEVFEDIEALRAAGRLYSTDRYENLAFDYKKRKTEIKALCLHIAHDCNMTCQYCFAGKGEYQGSKALMSFEVGKAALDFLIAHSGRRRNLEVDFFGGEPLLNFEVVKQIVAYAREIEKKYNKNFRFTLTTNGVLLTDEVMEFVNRECYNVVLSLDGRKETNDRMRKTLGGQGTYDRILPRFKKLADLRNQEGYYIRGTYTHYNTDFTNDIFDIADQGFKQLAMEPVVSDPSEPYALRPEDLPVLKEQYEILAKEMLRRDRVGNGFTFYHYMIDLSGGPCLYKRISGCGVGTEYMAVTPWGDLYPCHQFVGNEAFRLGDVFNGVQNTDLQDEFKLCNIYARKECKDCFAKMFCGGGCTANAYHATGSLTGIYEFGCELHRKRIECAIMVKAAEALDEQEALEAAEAQDVSAAPQDA